MHVPFCVYTTGVYLVSIHVNGSTKTWNTSQAKTGSLKHHTLAPQLRQSLVELDPLV